MIGDVHPGIHEMRVVERFESIKLLSTLFRGAIASEQMTSEIDSYFRHSGMPIFILRSSYLHCSNQVFLTIRS